MTNNPQKINKQEHDEDCKADHSDFSSSCGNCICKDLTQKESHPEAEEWTFKTELEEHLDEHFPKGECKERGSALVLFAWANIFHKRYVASQRQELLNSNNSDLENYHKGYFQGKADTMKKMMEKQKIIEPFFENYIQPYVDKMRQALVKELLESLPEEKQDADLSPGFNVTAGYRIEELRGSNSCRSLIKQSLE